METGKINSMLRFANQFFTCQQCGKCCRSFRVAVTPQESRRFCQMSWPSSENIPSDILEQAGTQLVFKRNGKHACLLLDSGNRCLMHRHFGHQAKALSCRAYPLEFIPTFNDEIRVAARYDCPAVLSGHGKPLASQFAEISSIIADTQLNIGSGFTPRECSNLSRASLERITVFFIQAIQRDATPVPALAAMAHRLEKLGTNFLEDSATMDLILPSMRNKATFEFNMEGFRLLCNPSWPERTELRRQLIYFLRRDEMLPDFSFKTRLRQTKAIAKVFLGGGNPAEFCASEHPSVSLRQCHLFDEAFWQQPMMELIHAMSIYRKFLTTKLESLQFFGRSYYGKPFFDGLKALLGTWPCAILLARIHAYANHRNILQHEDGCYATAAIDHCLGRKLNLS